MKLIRNARWLWFRSVRSAASALVLFFVLGCTGRGGSQDRPNVVFYMVDTLRADHLSCYGYGRATSPNMDAIAAEGVVFENAHAQSNWTQPSVASMITSLPPLSFNDFSERVPAAALTLAEVLKGEGYRTGGFTTTAAVAGFFGFNQGFDVYKESGDELSLRDRKMREGPLFDADTLFDMQLPWLRANAGEEPFFLYLHSVDPHSPLTPPDEFDVFGEAYDGPIDGTIENLKGYKDRADIADADFERLLALYDAEILYNDHILGKLVEELRALGVWDNTLIVIVSDHGQEFFDRGQHAHGHENLHEELTHVPLIMRLPATIPGGVRVPELVSGVDVMPTILGLLGIPAPDQVTGRDLRPLLESGGSVAAVDSFSFRAKGPRSLSALRTDQWFLHANPKRDWELYRLAEEGRELREDHWPKLSAQERAEWEERIKPRMRRRLDTETYFRGDGAAENEAMPDDIKDRLQGLGYLDSEE